LPYLEVENRAIYEVYRRVFGEIENVDIFRVLELVGIKKEDYLYCLDLVQSARGEVTTNKQLKKGVK